jgi:hypothetical protein
VLVRLVCERLPWRDLPSNGKVLQSGSRERGANMDRIYSELNRERGGVSRIMYLQLLLLKHVYTLFLMALLERF